MAIQYYPRIDDPAAIKLVAELVKKTPAQATDMATSRHDHQYYYATASQFAQESELRSFRESAVAIAESLGFPHAATSNKKREFDQKMSNLLFKELELIPAEAANQEVWNFLTLVLLPDLAKWRYPNPSNIIDYNRWLGEDRNVFRKLWWREATLGHELNSKLGEDEAVGIMERPLLGGQTPVARAMVRALLTVEREFADQPRSELMRVGAVNLRRYAPFTAFEFYTEDQIDKFVLNVFRTSSIAYREKRMAESSPSQEKNSAPPVHTEFSSLERHQPPGLFSGLIKLTKKR